MRDPKRIEKIINLIREIWYPNPDLRLTQIIMNALQSNEDPYYVEDADLEEKLKEYIKLLNKD